MILGTYIRFSLLFPSFRRPLHVTLCFVLYQHHHDMLSLQNHFVLKNRIHDSDGLKMYMLSQKNTPPQNITSNSNLYYSFQNCQVLGCKTFKQWNWGTCEILVGFGGCFWFGFLLLGVFSFLRTTEISIIKHPKGTSMLMGPYINLLQLNTKMINFYLLSEGAPMEEKLSPP